MTTRYRFDPGQSRFTVQAFATGMLSFLGHSPTFAVRDFTGAVTFDGGKVAALRLELTARADSLQLLDDVRPADRAEIEGTMRRDVLQTAAWPEVAFEAVAVASEMVARGQYRVRLGGALALHGATQAHSVDAEVLVYDDGIRLRGDCPLRLSDHRIRPVTALGGTIKLKDELRVSFDLAALPEGP